MNKIFRKMRSSEFSFRCLFVVIAMLTSYSLSTMAQDREAYVVLSTDNTTLSFYYDNLKDSRNGTVYSVNDYSWWFIERPLSWGAENSPWSDAQSSITTVVFDDSFAEYDGITTTSSWFYCCINLKNIIGISNLNTSNVTIMNFMFENCCSLTSLDLSSFNTEKVIDMGDMFYGCSNITTIDLSSFNTANVTSMTWMFQDCTSLKTIYVSDGWNVDNLERPYGMFNNCISLVGQDGTTFDENYTDNTKAYAGPGGYLTMKGQNEPSLDDNIVFADATVKTLCIANWDTNGDGELSYSEAAAVSNLGEVFYNNESITSFDELAYFTGLNSISGWSFSNCSSLTSVTIPNSVTSVGSNAFSGCIKLNHLFIPDNVISISEIAFNGCSGITTITVDSNNSKYDSRNNCNAIIETSSNKLIRGCINTLIPSDVEIIGTMAFNCVSLTSITIPYNVKKIQERAFQSCKHLYSIVIPSSVTIISSSAFNDCVSLSSVFLPKNLSFLGDRTFDNCKNLVSVSVGSRSPVSISNTTFSNRVNATLYVPAGCKAAYEAVDYWKDFKEIIELGANGQDVEAYAVLSSDGTILSFYYDVLKSFREGTVYNTLGYSSWNESSLRIRTVVFDDSFADYNGVTSTDSWFSNCYNLSTIIDIDNLNTSNVISMNSMFNHCASLTSLNLSSFNTAKVKSMSNMFACCYDLTSLDISSFNTANVENMSNMFSSSSRLTALDLSSFNTSNVTKMRSMFFGCSGLRRLHVSSFNTANVTDMYMMFANCSNLPSLDVSSFNTEKVATMEHMFYGCSGLTNIDISSFSTAKVTNMAAMFYGCKNLKTIYVSNGWDTDNVSSSGSMFRNCNSIVGQDGTTFDGNYIDKTKAYAGPGGYLTMKGQNEPSLDDNIVFADANVKAICVNNWDTNGDGELSYGEAAAVTSITENSGFKNNTITSFDELSYFTGLTQIGKSAFYRCRNMTSVTIPNGLTSIGENAFRECGALASFTIPSSVVNIGNCAFIDCSILTTATIPESVTSIGYSIFDGCSLTSIIVKTGNIKYDSRDNCNAIIETATNTLIAGCKNTIIPNSVTCIGYRSFEGCTGLTSLTIPESVTSIGDYAFEGCIGLTSITIPSSVTSIGYATFWRCSGLTSVIIPESVTSIDYAAFQDCSSLASITIPNGLTSIGDNAFDGCNNLTSVTVDITTPLPIEPGTFSNRANATLYVPVGSKSKYEAANYWKEFRDIQEIIPGYGVGREFVENGLRYRVNNDCVTVTLLGFASNPMSELVIPETVVDGSLTVTEIITEAFINCATITKVVIPKTVTLIGERAFKGCSGLIHIYIHSTTIINITATVFEGTHADRVLYVPGGMKPGYRNHEVWPTVFPVIRYIPGSEFAENGIRYRVNEDGVTVIVLGFDGAPTDELVIPETVDGGELTVTAIIAEAFINCATITKVVIPKTVTLIGERAFMGCSGLIHIYVHSTTVININVNVFEGTHADRVLYVPGGMKPGYRNHNVWSTIFPIIRYIPGSEFAENGIRYRVNEDGITVIVLGFDGDPTSELVIPETVDGGELTVTAIIAEAFINRVTITKVVIPKTVTLIGERAFKGCSGLIHIYVHSTTVININVTVFEGTHADRVLYVPGGMKPGYRNHEVWPTVFPVIRYIPGSEFAENGIRYRVNEDGITVIVLGFDGDPMTELVIPETVDGGNLTVTAIIAEAFINITTITKVVIPKTVTVIGERAFKGCTGLMHIYVHSTTVINITATVFEGTPDGRVLYVPGGMKPGYRNHEVWPTLFPVIRYIPGSEFAEIGIRYRVNEDGITVIVLGFDGDPTSELVIPETVDGGELTVTAIITEAFINQTAITKVVIPKSVTVIGEKAFYGCTNLIHVTIHSTTIINIVENVFQNIHANAVLYVPVGMRPAYMNHSIWSVRFNVIRYIVGSEFVENGLRYRVNEDGVTVTLLGFDGDAVSELVIPETVDGGELTVTAIITEAFINHTTITKVVIPNTVTLIGERAFNGCTKLIHVTILNTTIINIVDNVFVNIHPNAVLYVPVSVRDAYVNHSTWSTLFKFIRYTIGSEFVYNGIRYRVNDDGETVTIIGYTDDVPEELEIPETVVGGLRVTTIIQEAFINCTRITRVVIPASITVIGDKAFKGCVNLVYVYVHSTTIINITANVFENIHANAILYVPVSMKQSYVSHGTWYSLFPTIRYIPGSEFVENGLRLRVNNDGETATLFGYTDDVSAEVNIPETVAGGSLRVTIIANETFINCKKITKVVIPASITVIGDKAFYGCTNLIHVTIHSTTVINISANVFQNIHPNAVLYVPGSIRNTYVNHSTWSTLFKTISYTAGSEFVYNGIHYIVNNDGTVTIIGYTDDVPEELEIPETVVGGLRVTTIRQEAFVNCTRIIRVVLPASITVIGERAFANCTNIISIVVRNTTVINIHTNVFDGLPRTVVLYVPKGYYDNYSRTSGWNSFGFIDEGEDGTIVPYAVLNEDKTTLTFYYDNKRHTRTGTIYLWRNFRTGENDGWGLHKSTITNVVFDNTFRKFKGLTSTAYWFHGCVKLTTITNIRYLVTVKVTNISYMYYRCSSLKTIVIPNKATTISYDVISGCTGLTSVTIPGSITTIDNNAFQDCSSLTSVYLRVISPLAISSTTFSTRSNATLYVPKESVTAYKSSDYWRDFGNIEELPIDETDVTEMADAIYVVPATASTGKNVTVKICLKNDQTATAYSFDLVLPTGITVATDGNGAYLDTQSGRHDDHNPTINDRGNGTYSFATLSPYSEELSGNDGPIRLVTLHVDSNVDTGSYPIEIKNAKYSLPIGLSVAMEETTSSLTVVEFIKGDTNEDCEIDIADAVSIVNYIVNKPYAHFDIQAADVNGDGEVDIADAVTIVNFIVGKTVNLSRAAVALPDPE